MVKDEYHWAIQPVIKYQVLVIRSYVNPPTGFGNHKEGDFMRGTVAAEAYCCDIGPYTELSAKTGPYTQYLPIPSVISSYICKEGKIMRLREPLHIYATWVTTR